MSLVLHRNSGYVSPQFHVVHDRLFESLRTLRPACLWRTQVGLMSADDTPPTRQRLRVAINNSNAPPPQRRRLRHHGNASYNATTPQVLRGSDSASQVQDGPPPLSDAHRPNPLNASRPTNPRIGATAQLAPRRRSQRLVQPATQAVAALLAISS